MSSRRKPLAERFWANVHVGGPDECWEYAGRARVGGGYAVFQMGRGVGTVRAHRVAWELANRPLMPGEWVLHRCDNPPCCNPAHLYIGDHVQNMKDMKDRKRSRSAKATHCPRGHPYSEENTWSPPNGGPRRCRKCLKEQKRRRYLDPTKSR